MHAVGSSNPQNKKDNQTADKILADFKNYFNIAMHYTVFMPLL